MPSMHVNSSKYAGEYNAAMQALHDKVHYSFRKRCPQHLTSQARPVMHHNGIAIAQGGGLHQWFVQ